MCTMLLCACVYKYIYIYIYICMYYTYIYIHFFQKVVYSRSWTLIFMVSHLWIDNGYSYPWYTDQFSMDTNIRDQQYFSEMGCIPSGNVAPMGLAVRIPPYPTSAAEMRCCTVGQSKALHKERNSACCEPNSRWERDLITPTLHGCIFYILPIDS